MKHTSGHGTSLLYPPESLIKSCKTVISMGIFFFRDPAHCMSKKCLFVINRHSGYSSYSGQHHAQFTGLGLSDLQLWYHGSCSTDPTEPSRAAGQPPFHLLVHPCLWSVVWSVIACRLGSLKMSLVGTESPSWVTRARLLGGDTKSCSSFTVQLSGVESNGACRRFQKPLAARDKIPSAV